jgi:dimethylaniline monooxygenase (N-oxide forming)
MCRLRVAIIGGGPGGIVAAKFLKDRGFRPIVFEQGSDIGGQWNTASPHSGAWPGMRANTSRVTTQFSDLSHADCVPVFPSDQDMLTYLRSYAQKFDLLRHIRLGMRVRSIVRLPIENSWRIQFDGPSLSTAKETFPYIVVACGRHRTPVFPNVPGLDTFLDKGRVAHTFSYKECRTHRGLRVLVLGGGVSALEIASELALLGASRVVNACRRQRYIIPKFVNGRPTDHVAFTRIAALSAELFPKELTEQRLKEFVLSVSGTPDQYGALRPNDEILRAGLSQSQYYLPLVAEGRISVRPWVRQITGSRVHFIDNHAEEFDDIIFGTGYQTDLSFLEEGLQADVRSNDSSPRLYYYTFHPTHPNIAFVGLLDLMGPYFPILELQARWIANTWSGASQMPTRDAMLLQIREYQSRRERGGNQMHIIATAIARAANVEPFLANWPDLTRALLFGPLSALSYRLDGPDSLYDAPTRYADDAAMFGCIITNDLSVNERRLLSDLAPIDATATLRKILAR